MCLQVLEVLGSENVKLNKMQVQEMINLLKAEMELAEEEKIKEKLEKDGKKEEKEREEEEKQKASN